MYSSRSAKIFRASGVIVAKATMPVKMTSHSSFCTSSQVWLAPFLGLPPVTPCTASATSPASSVIFSTRRSRATSGETGLSASSHSTRRSMVFQVSSCMCATPCGGRGWVGWGRYRAGP